MVKARDIIKGTIIKARLSYKTLKVKSICYILICKDSTCIKISLIIYIWVIYFRVPQNFHNYFQVPH